MTDEERQALLTRMEASREEAKRMTPEQARERLADEQLREKIQLEGFSTQTPDSTKRLKLRDLALQAYHAASTPTEAKMAGVLCDLFIPERRGEY